MTLSVWIWSTVPAQHVTASASAGSSPMWKPRFTLCPAANNSTCSVGSLPADQAFEVVIKDHINSTATTGDQLTLTVAVTGTGLSPAEAAIATVVGQPASSPGPTTTLPPVTYYPVSGTTVTPGSLSSIFPVVTPTSNPAGGSGSGRKSTRYVPTASTLPIDPRLIGGQLAGLAVLAAAITMAVARLSLRTPQPAGPSTPAPPVFAQSAPSEPAPGQSAPAQPGPAPATPLLAGQVPAEPAKGDGVPPDRPAS